MVVGHGMRIVDSKCLGFVFTRLCQGATPGVHTSIGLRHSEDTCLEFLDCKNRMLSATPVHLDQPQGCQAADVAVDESLDRNDVHVAVGAALANGGRNCSHTRTSRDMRPKPPLAPTAESSGQALHTPGS